MKTTNRELPDLTRTEAALSEYDAFDRDFKAEGSQAEVIAAFDQLESKARAVGHAFGLDTADRNNLLTCERCVRPGFAGSDSFVRRMVAKWRANT